MTSKINTTTSSRSFNVSNNKIVLFLVCVGMFVSSTGAAPIRMSPAARRRSNSKQLNRRLDNSKRRLHGEKCKEGFYGCPSGFVCDHSSGYGGVCTVTDPCTSVNCGPGGKCISMTDTEVSCRCEDTFEEVLNSKGKPYCGCPEGTTFDADVNRCFAPPTMVPTKELTVSPTASPTSSPTSSPTEEDKNVCVDDASGTFVLDNDEVASCDWLTKNSAKEEQRKNKYCYRHEVKTLCPLTCDFCECVDDSTYTFTVVKTGKTVYCSWLTKNESKMDNRIANYCTEDFDGGFLLDACTKSCGKCA